jgi:ABC-type oligopeptide transport system substrate-binding subunit
VNNFETGSNNLFETYIQENFRQIGVSMEIEVLERSVSIQRLENGDFEATRLMFHNTGKSNQLLSFKNKFQLSCSLLSGCVISS